MALYIVITEDGKLFISEICSEDMKQACDDGMLQVVAITEGTEPVEYYKAEWHPLPEFTL